MPTRRGVAFGLLLLVLVHAGITNSSAFEESKARSHSNTVASVSFSPDGKYALSGSWDGTLKLWDVATGNEIRTLAPILAKGASITYNEVAFSADGKSAWSVDRFGFFQNWDLATGKEIRTILCGRRKDVAVAFSSNRSHALLGDSDGAVRLCDLITGQEIWAVKGHDGQVFAVAFSPDDGQALTGGYWNSLKLWDLHHHRLVGTFESTSRMGAIQSAAFARDGRRALSGNKDLITLWDVSAGKPITNFGFPVRVITLAFSPDGKYALVGGQMGMLGLLDLEKGPTNDEAVQGAQRTVRELY